jgi:hypothetical protein
MRQKSEKKLLRKVSVTMLHVRISHFYIDGLYLGILKFKTENIVGQSLKIII